MSQQHTFASIAYTTRGNVTRRERFLAEMGTVIPWTDLLALIAPHFHEAGRGAPSSRNHCPALAARFVPFEPLACMGAL